VVIIVGGQPHPHPIKYLLNLLFRTDSFESAAVTERAVLIQNAGFVRDNGTN